MPQPLILVSPLQADEDSAFKASEFKVIFYINIDLGETARWSLSKEYTINNNTPAFRLKPGDIIDFDFPTGVGDTRGKPEVWGHGQAKVERFERRFENGRLKVHVHLIPVIYM